MRNSPWPAAQFLAVEIPDSVSWQGGGSFFYAELILF
jgi:hypothetical protein